MLGKSRGAMLAPMASRALGVRLTEAGETELAMAADAALEAGLSLDLLWCQRQMEGNPNWLASGRPKLPGSIAVKIAADKSRRRRRRVAA